MIGGREENHFFVLAKRGCLVEIGMNPATSLFGDLTLTGYGPNYSLQEVDAVIERLNAVDQVATAINRDFTREVICDQLRTMADSSQHPLIALYALNASNFAEHFPENQSYYRRFLRKWKHERSDYFLSFRNQINPDRSILGQVIIVGAVLLLLITIIFGSYLWKNKEGTGSPYSELTIQERRVFDMLKEGRSNKEIAEAFSVSVSTVKSHVNSIFSKLGVNSRREIMDL